MTEVSMDIGSIERRLDRLDIKLEDIAQTLKLVAVQGERINNIQDQILDVKKSHSQLVKWVTTLQQYQDRCPIKSMSKIIWCIQVPQAIAILALAGKLFNLY